MKNKVCTAIATVMLPIPWTILPLRTLDWALESPAAGILIYSYAALMICSGVFCVLTYTKWHVKNRWMQICTVIHGIYAAGAVGIVGLALSGLF